MRVLTVGNMYPPHHFGGYELVWRSAVEHLRARGHDVRVLTTDVDTGAVEPDAMDVHRELRWHLRDGEFQPIGLRARAALARHNHRVLARHLTDFEPDVVSWWSMGGLSLTMLEAVRRRGTPAVGFVHDDWLEYGLWADAWLHTFSGPRRGRLAPLAEAVSGIPARVDFASAATYVFVSDFTRRKARELGPGVSRTAVAHSGIDPAFLDAAPTKQWAWQLLYVGRLDERKGVDTAIEALARLPPEAHLTIVGGWDTREESRLRSLTRDLCVGDRVTFAGQRDRGELMAAYADADAVVFPVRWDEPWGLVPLEAMGRGRPVVATGRGGSGEYLRHGQNCLLSPADDPDALAAALVRLADEPDLRDRLRAAGFATAARHTEPIFNEAVEAATLAAAAGEQSEPVGRDVPLRILHLGTGFRPLRHGGLVAYAEDLMAEQVREGHEVSYLFSGRHHLLASRLRMRRWRRRGVAMFEVVNSPLSQHGAQPDLEIAETRIERMVGQAIAELRPDVIHVQELAGLPSSVLDVARRAGVPTVLTLQDYFLLCPTFKLLDSRGQVCLRTEVGADCVATVAAQAGAPAMVFQATLRYDLMWRRPLRRLGSRVERWAVSKSENVGRRKPPAPPASAGTFQRRRDVNVERLNRTDCVIAMSDRVAEIHAQLGVDQERLRTVQLTLGHIERLRPRVIESASPVCFGTLGGGESVAKGAHVLLEAWRAVGDEARAGKLRLVLLGRLDPSVEEEVRDLPGVEIRGSYSQDQLDEVLRDIDVGIVPSVWEEAYGYAGVEFLAKGIPIIGNAIGGIGAYVRDGETGWLNFSCSADELAGIIRDIAERPDQVAQLNARIRAARGSIVRPMAHHAAEMESIYRELGAAHGRS